jgi:hypothetical protein
MISVDLLDHLMGCVTLVTLPFDLFIRVYARSPRSPIRAVTAQPPLGHGSRLQFLACDGLHRITP